MYVNPNKDGGRSLVIDTPFLLFKANVDANNTVHIEEVEVREYVSKVEKKKDCGGCKKNKKKEKNINIDLKK